MIEPISDQIVYIMEKNDPLDYRLKMVQQDTTWKAQTQNAIHEFAHQLHVRLSRNSPTSICFAPMSIVPVLGMILKGLPEDRKQIFLQALGLQDVPEPTVHLTLMEILDDLSKADGDVAAVRIANAIAAPLAGGVHPHYLQEVANGYKGEIFHITRVPEEAAKAINDWVAGKTEGEIKNLVTPDDFETNNPAEKPFALLNAVYFAGEWEKNFEEARDDLFTFANEGRQQVKMMSLQKDLKGYEGDTFRMLEIPYHSPEGHNLAHLVFLPRAGQTLGTLEKRLTPALIKQCREQAIRESYNVKMPKIDVSVKVGTLLDILHEMGLPIRGEQLPHLGERAEIKKVIHQAKVKVDEKGTKAAAATAATGMCSCAAPVRRPDPKDFFIDHDYAYYIVDGDNVLFQGNVKDCQALVK